MDKTEYFKTKLLEFEQKPNEEIVEFLKFYWQIDSLNSEDYSFKLIATYEKSSKVDKNGKSFGFFKNVRNLSGDLLYYPFNVDLLFYPFKREPAQVFSPHNPTFEKEQYWLINVRLASDFERMKHHNPFMLQLANQIVGKPSLNLADRLKKEELTRTIFNNTGATENDAINTSGSLRLIMADLYENEDDRFIYELLQNADDFPQNGENVSVNIKLLDKHLIFAHSGRPFSERDVESICRINDSTKKSEENTIGYKGIGFKSVFSDNVETVFVNSGNFSFAFDKLSPIYKGKDTKNIPWQIKPIWEEKYRLPKEIQDEDVYFRMPVAFAINIGDERERYDKAITELLSASKFLLFLRHVNEISYSNGYNTITLTKEDHDGQTIIKTDAENSCWITTHYVIPIPEDIRYELQTERAIPQKLKQVTSTEIIFAAEIKDNKIVCQQNTSLFSYLPTKVRDFKFPFVVNADFLTTASRESIHTKSVWNKFLFKTIGGKCLQFIGTLHNFDDYLQLLVSDYISEDNALSTDFNESYRNALKEMPFIRNQNGSPAKQSDIIIDRTGLSKVIGAELFCKLIGTQKLLPAENIISSVLENKIFEEIEKVDFDEVIKSILNNPKFNQWFVSANTAQKEQLYKWINERNTPSRVEKMKDLASDLPIFHFETENGYVDVSACEIKENNGFYEGLLLDYPQGVLQDLYENDHDSYIRLIENRDAKFHDAYWEGIIIHPLSYYVINTSNIYSIKDVIKKIHCHYLFSLEANCTKLPFNCSSGIFNENHPLFKLVTPPDDEGLFSMIGKSDFSLLDFDERKTLFFALKELHGIGPEKLKEIALFKNQNGEFKPLGEMSAYCENVPTWLSEYVLRKDEDDGSFGKYLIDDEGFFEKIVWKHRNDIGVTITELYKTIPWTDEKYTKELIDQYKQEDRLQELLPILEDDGTSNTTKKYFLDKIEKVEFQSDKTYKKDSWEYRVLQIAMQVYEDPSTFSNKIFFDGFCIDSFSVSDDVVCKYGPNNSRSVTFSLAKLLPQDQNKSDVIARFKGVFEEKKNMDVFFVTKPMPLSSIVRSLESKDYLGLTYGEWKYDKGGNAYQYLFYVYYYRGVKGWTSNYAIHIKLENESDVFIQEMMDFLKGNNIDINTSPFTFRIHQYFTGKYFDNDFIFDTEQLLSAIERWCGEDESKREYLYANGVKRNTDYTIKFRQLFQKNEVIDFVDKMLDADLATSVRFVAHTSGYKRPFSGDNQRAVLLSLKEKKRGNIISIRNLEKIIQESKEWDSKKYAQWIKNHHPKIYLYPGILPNRLYYNTPNDNLLLDYEEDVPPYYYDKNNSRLYISGEKNINDQLIKIVQDGNFTLESFQFLCLEGNDIISREEIEENKRINKEKDKKITELQEELRLYKNKFGEIIKINEEVDSVIQETNTSENDREKHFDGYQDEIKQSYKEKEREQYEQTIRDFLGGSFNLDQYNTKSEHIISCYRILKYLEEQGFQIASDFDQKQFVGSDDYQKIKLQDGVWVNPCGAKWGVWYIHPNVWRDIVINGNWACVCTGNGENDFILIKTEEDLGRIANPDNSILMKINSSDDNDALEVVNTVFPGIGNDSMDVHLMIKLHDTPDEVFNSIFDKMYELSRNEDFTI